MEAYHTLSKACFDCPFNQTDCFRPHCVPADGFEKSILTVNRMIPGPAIQVQPTTEKLKLNIYCKIKAFIVFDLQDLSRDCNDLVMRAVTSHVSCTEPSPRSKRFSQRALA